MNQIKKKMEKYTISTMLLFTTLPGIILNDYPFTILIRLLKNYTTTTTITLSSPAYSMLNISLPLEMRV